MMNNNHIATMLVKRKGPCWEGYEQIGMKMKNGRKVPNCVPIKGVKKSCDCDDCDLLTKALLSKKSDKPFHGYNPKVHSRKGGLSGVKGPTSKGGKRTPKGAALDRWNC